MKSSRRRFLYGAGGAVLALPWLESIAGKRASAQVTPPKRLVVMFFAHGLVRTRWMPASTGALPATGNISDLLAPLNGVRDDIVVVSGVGNPTRHLVEGDNHRRTNTTILTNARPQTDALAGGESIDQAAARLLTGDGLRSSVLLPLSAGDGGPAVFFSETGGVVSPLTRFSSNPRTAAEVLFGSLPSEPTEPTEPTDPGESPEVAPPTLRERLRGGRSTIVDAVAENLGDLRRRVSVEDRARLDAHAEHLQTLSRRYAPAAGMMPMMPGGPGGMPRAPVVCEAPDYGAIPDVPTARGEAADVRDVETSPAQIDNLVRAFACDITRVGSLYFNTTHAPTFPWLFGGSVTACSEGFMNWHDMIHTGQPTGSDADRGVRNLMTGQSFYMDQLALLIERLRDTPDIDGTSSLLDNTLVVAMSDFGNENHGTYNIPIVLAGMPDQIGAGRHVAAPGQTIGDLFATVLEILGAPEGSTLGLTVGELDWGSMSDRWAWNDGTPPAYYQGSLLPL